ncbi:Hypothetical predicted protein [Xyrichtys novacula]|uniref:Uncharacterized protein n=1 Tax=Xyrichtys novacula TaxID=13765 RepID=A0AAV1G204_XYRNO|nr:Hypothetical predicted protein [Xyrichtys novacula]
MTDSDIASWKQIQGFIYSYNFMATCYGNLFFFKKMLNEQETLGGGVTRLPCLLHMQEVKHRDKAAKSRAAAGLTRDRRRRQVLANVWRNDLKISPIIITPPPEKLESKFDDCRETQKVLKSRGGRRLELGLTPFSSGSVYGGVQSALGNPRDV